MDFIAFKREMMELGKDIVEKQDIFLKCLNGGGFKAVDLRLHELNEINNLINDFTSKVRFVHSLVNREESHVAIDILIREIEIALECEAKKRGF